MLTVKEVFVAFVRQDLQERFKEACEERFLDYSGVVEELLYNYLATESTHILTALAETNSRLEDYNRLLQNMQLQLIDTRETLTAREVAEKNSSLNEDTIYQEFKERKNEFFLEDLDEEVFALTEKQQFVLHTIGNLTGRTHTVGQIVEACKGSRFVVFASMPEPTMRSIILALHQKGYIEVIVDYSYGVGQSSRRYSRYQLTDKGLEAIMLLEDARFSRSIK